MSLTFPFRKETSALFGEIFRPTAEVSFWSKKFNLWDEITMIVDTGADYTVLPYYLADEFGIDLENEGEPFYTQGVGGKERIYVVKNQKVKLGEWAREIPVGFLERDTIPPLMGRHLFLETFETCFSKTGEVHFNE